MYGQATTESDEPMMAQKSVSSAGQLLRPLSSNIAKEKKAIDEVLDLLSINLDELEMSIAAHADHINPVSSGIPSDAPDSIGFEYLGSSTVYDRLHSDLNRVATAADIVRTLTRRLEV